MKDQDLVRMANQIAGFFASYPRPEAVRETAAHIRAFWEPRMRRQIELFVAEDGSGLDPIASEAVLSLKSGASESPVH